MCRREERFRWTIRTSRLSRQCSPGERFRSCSSHPYDRIEAMHGTIVLEHTPAGGLTARDWYPIVWVPNHGSPMRGVHVVVATKAIPGRIKCAFLGRCVGWQVDDPALLSV